MSLELQVTDTTTIQDLQRTFHSAYPYLKIEFADKPHAYGNPSVNSHWYEPQTLIFKIARKFKKGSIPVDPWSRTGDVEEMFRQEFGLYPQVFRREGEKWIQTYGTDIFSLDQQNEIGKDIDKKRYGNLWIEREAL